MLGIAPPAGPPRHAAGRHQPGPARLHHRHRARRVRRRSCSPMLAGDFEEEQRSRCSRAGVERDGTDDLRRPRAERRDRQPRRDRRHGRAADRDRRRLRRQPARRRADRRLADRLDGVRAVGRRADPAPGQSPAGCWCRSRRTTCRTGRSSLPDSGEVAIEIVAGRDASVNFDMQSLTSLAARRPDPRAPLGRTACASSIRAAGATSRRCAASCTGRRERSEPA